MNCKSRQLSTYNCASIHNLIFLLITGQHDIITDDRIHPVSTTICTCACAQQASSLNDEGKDGSEQSYVPCMIQMDPTENGSYMPPS